jgi:glycosyltransferase involved in cell wall biosynthesis
MRIAIIAEVFLPKIDGVVQRTLSLIRHLVDSGDEVLVICPQADGCTGCPVPVVPISSFPFLLYPEYRIGTPDRSLGAVIKRFDPDVVHYVNPFAFGFVCYDLMQKARIRIPSIFSFHTLYGEFVKQYRLLKPLSLVLWWMMREYHNRADINITVSSIMQEDLCRRGFRRVRLWPPAVDGNLFRPEARTCEMRARLANGHADKKVLLTVSRLAPEKNVGFLADLVDQLPDACLAIVGDGPHRGALERRFAGKNAHFLGYLQGKELAAAYASADAFVYASETETMGNVVLEAMASGGAVVAPRAGGIPSLVDSGKTGLLYAPGNLAEAVRSTSLVLGDALIRARLGRAARDWVENRNWSSSIEEVRRIYKESIEQFQKTATKRTFMQKLARAVLATLITGFRSMDHLKRARYGLRAPRILMRARRARGPQSVRA